MKCNEMYWIRMKDHELSCNILKYIEIYWNKIDVKTVQYDTIQ